MGSRLKRFWRDQRGTSFEGIALSVSVIAVAFVASADMLDYMTKQKTTPDAVVAFRRTTPVPSIAASPDLDQTPTASLPRLVSRSVLDPCTGAVK